MAGEALHAGVTGTFTLSSAYDTNLDRTSIGAAGFFTQAGAHLDYRLKGERTNGVIALEGTGFLYPDAPESNYTLQNVRAGIGGRFGREAYAIYDYREIDAFVEGRRKFGSRGAFLGGYAFRQRSYESLAVYDNAAHRLYT